MFLDLTPASQYFRAIHAKIFEFSRNTQSWQCWHYCTTLNGNKLVIVTSWINFNANVHLSWHFEPKYGQLCLPWFSNVSKTKMPTLPTLCIIGKLFLLMFLKEKVINLKAFTTSTLQPPSNFQNILKGFIQWTLICNMSRRARCYVD